ncbi:hypothetical protein [Lysinibacillus piscis]|uniref:Uncharacterized protein n=1 Tax=Lysinibacillus piscis TaxID=2518931 RepID=A0ABQ5NLE3_9BACI|nr:hypothetical protein [Lysinibacillus sp. KH24]GLC88938.1 hypothetical protein LYSBPC_20650 [Lysinibacillus sp. KH24]
MIIYIKSQPPLAVHQYMAVKDSPTATLIEIENTGVRNITLQQVLVNDQRVDTGKLIVSKEAPFVAGMTITGREDLSIYNIRQIDIVPDSTTYYALKIDHSSIQTITIQYHYLKFPFTFKMKLQTKKEA